MQRWYVKFSNGMTTIISAFHFMEAARHANDRAKETHLNLEVVELKLHGDGI